MNRHGLSSPMHTASRRAPGAGRTPAAARRAAASAPRRSAPAPAARPHCSHSASAASDLPRGTVREVLQPGSPSLVSRRRPCRGPSRDGRSRARTSSGWPAPRSARWACGGEAQPPHRRLEIVVDDAPGRPAEVGEGPHVAVEESKLYPGGRRAGRSRGPSTSVASGTSRPCALTVQLDGDLEEVAWASSPDRCTSGTKTSARCRRHSPQVAPHQRHPDLVALLTQLAVQPRRRQPPLRRRPLRPLGQQLIEARPHPLERRTVAHPLLRYRLRLCQVAPHGVVAAPHPPGDRALTLALDQMA